jgi:hypothetical protein
VTTGSGRIVGVHIIGASAGETIHSFVPAVREGRSHSRIRRVDFRLSHAGGNRASRGNEYYKEALQSPTARWLLSKVVR